ncbi:MAG: hypothetical protein ACRYG7_20170 [Janthinobacterium lividum]
MLLTSFLQDLLTTGVLTLAGRPASFEAADLENADALLRAYHAEDALHLPHTAPDFDAAAARWAAHYLYYAALLTFVRELDETVIIHYLPSFPAEMTPAASYSVDLTFRYLPDFLRLAKGLAPGDYLVAHLRAAAQQWPLSFVGQELAEASAEAMLLAHPALRATYVDRIIRERDRTRAALPHLTPLIQEALGDHSAELWPDFHTFTLLA